MGRLDIPWTAGRPAHLNSDTGSNAGFKIHWSALWFAYLLLTILLFARPPFTNFVFDEQEALLANPYLQGRGSEALAVLDAFRRDFWGREVASSIGSYRPLPNLLWRLLSGWTDHPFALQGFNLLVHASNSCLLTRWLTARVSNLAALLGGLSFAALALHYEMVSGIVGLADGLLLLGGLSAMSSLDLKGPRLWLLMAVGVAVALLSKETAISLLPALPLLAFVLPQESLSHRARIALGTLLTTAVVFVAYVELRRRLFLGTTLPPLPAHPKLPAGLNVPLDAFLAWFAQPSLPVDPLNNPLVVTHGLPRLLTALDVAARSFSQLLLPLGISGDYSYPSTSIVRQWTLTCLGSAATLAVLGLGALALPWFAWRRRPASSTAALGLTSLVWALVFWFPVSNLLVLLPTIRANRLWSPVGISMAIGIALIVQWLQTRKTRFRMMFLGLWLIWFAIQATTARLRANDFANDLRYWERVVHARPTSAKGQLNYGLMLGARGDLPARYQHNRRAAELAPSWAMAKVYTADVLCRMHKAQEAWPWYVKGLPQAASDQALSALALQCLYEEKMILAGPDTANRDAQLQAISDAHRGSWLAFLWTDMQSHAADHAGVDAKYRPRGYNQRKKSP